MACRTCRTPTPDGAIILASSSDQKNRHALARLDVAALLLGGADEDDDDKDEKDDDDGDDDDDDDDAAAVSVEHGKRPLLLPPVVDGVGYTLLLRQDKGNDKIKRVRKSALGLEPATIADLCEQL